MKKALIAGAASVALAAMPVVGVFAANDPNSVLGHTDTINISLNQVCTFGTVTAGAANANTDATVHNPTSASQDYAGVWTGDTLAATLSAGNQYEALGTTTFTVRCNDAAGYTISAKTGTAAGTLVSGDNSIATADGQGYAAATAGTSYWNFKLGAAGTGLTIATDYDSPHAIPTDQNGTVVVSAAANSGNLQAGQSVTVTYGAGIDNAQPTGTYAGTVVYTLNAL